MLAKLLTVAFVAVVWGQTKSLSCSGGPSFEVFKATLDYSGYDPKSGYFSVKDASVIDNYATAQLICVGYSLESIDCVGYVFGARGNVIELNLTKSNATGVWSAQYTPIVGDLVQQHDGPWPCKDPH